MADPPPSYTKEMWAGGDASRTAWLAYSGATYAPYGMFEDGIRLRAAGGYGGYRYWGERLGEVRSFKAKTVFTDALVGYLKRLGPLTAKAFAGVSAIEHTITPYDPQNPVLGLEYGPKVVVEFWLNLGRNGYSSLDMNWTSAHETYGARARAGYRVSRHVSVGAEARLDGNALDKDTRGGVFTRYEWSFGEVSIAAGVSGRNLKAAQDITDPYATLTVLTQY